MKYGTTCSGVDAVSLAWEPIGMTPKFFSEVDLFANTILATRWAHVPNLGDLTQIDGRPWRGELDILWGSTPCQSVSLAGLRRGLKDPRGALMLSFVDLADEIDPQFVCWENVKGALSDKYNAFGHLLAALAGEDEPLVPSGKKWTHAGYVLGPKRNIAWRLFNAEYSGVPQQRERLFLVACPSDGPDPRDVLFESYTRSQVPPASGGTRSDLAAALETSAGERAFSVAFRGREKGERVEVGNQVANCLLAATGGSDKPHALVDDGVFPIIRRLTPIEAERLMGITDNHTLVEFEGRPASDTARYKVIGNSLNVLDVRWIGEQIIRVKREWDAKRPGY
jgi:DNA (cytosine-5)-methyltransferase 1